MLENKGFWPPKTVPKPSKTLPKSIQNRCSRTNLIPYAIVAQTFDIFKRRNLENINFPLGKSMFFRFSRKACLCGFGAFFLPKLIPKPFQNEVQTLQKSMPKTCWFSTSIFWGFGLDLGGSWAAKLAQNGFQTWGCSLKILRCSDFVTLLSSRSFENSVLEGSKLDFGGPRARFWRVWKWFLDFLANFLACCLEDVPFFSKSFSK